MFSGVQVKNKTPTELSEMFTRFREIQTPTYFDNVSQTWRYRGNNNCLRYTVMDLLSYCFVPNDPFHFYLI